ncbi:hypothetical protein TNIN_483941 [Trichonephila inaurata madagascariensis]|uniref:Uncharacterized protein n=1 Tax=Trichonephila inaurata madagascariensis TaxID=2747483 RepID=A0A8X7CEV0_9ARAC|nr:hypothetical protein TNIN_483941 [Trichonephila inaurata madagascariensis]
MVVEGSVLLSALSKSFTNLVYVFEERIQYSNLFLKMDKIDPLLYEMYCDILNTPKEGINDGEVLNLLR